MNLEGRDDASVDIVRLGLFGVEDVDGVTAAWDHEDRSIVEVAAEFLGVEGSGTKRGV